MKKFIAVIPARLGSTRFPGKPLALLNDKPLIQHVYEKTFQSGLFTRVIVATDHQAILEVVTAFGGEAMLTSSHHPSGTDRIAEVCRKLEFDIVVNVQGDEPFITREPLAGLLSVFDDPEIQAASLMNVLDEERDNPHIVKVVVDKNNFALYFSRSSIPYYREKSESNIYYKHIGVYAFRRQTLLKFVQLTPSFLEQAEKLEQLRLLENGIPIKMVLCDYTGWGIDIPEDLLEAERYLHRNSDQS
ncbi:MAG: 3-deoxy-manno-octulosonate cytidylyltransferase [Candidatus Cloacimonetes bacterium]|nr:3-deoxy-manno-octulosonate cytidylyltransferase [Candidatus Cloacimonadota bacterium]